MHINFGNTPFWYTDWTGLGPLCIWVDFVHISDSQLQLNQVWQAGSWALDRLATRLPNEVKDAINYITGPVNFIHEVQDRWVWTGH